MLLVRHGFSCGQEERGEPGAKRKDAVEDRERGVQHAEEAGVPSGASIQQGLPGDEKPLLPDSDWTYDRTVPGGMGADMEESKAKFGAKA